MDHTFWMMCISHRVIPPNPTLPLGSKWKKIRAPHLLFLCEPPHPSNILNFADPHIFFPIPPPHDLKYPQMTLICSLLRRHTGQTDRQTDRHYQVHYLPTSLKLLSQYASMTEKVEDASPYLEMKSQILIAIEDIV